MRLTAGCVDVRHLGTGGSIDADNSAPVCQPPKPPKLQCESGRPGPGSSRPSCEPQQARSIARNLQLDETVVLLVVLVLSGFRLRRPDLGCDGSCERPDLGCESLPGCGPLAANNVDL